MGKLTKSQKERLQQLNKKNNEFNENLIKNARSYSRALCIFSILVLFLFIGFLLLK